MIRRILVGLGDEDSAAAATETAIGLATAHGATLTGVCVLDAGRLSASGPVPIGAGHLAQELKEHRLSEAQRVIAEVGDQFAASCRRAGVEHRCESTSGEPYQCMSRRARYYDLIVCGLGHLFEHGIVDEPPSELVRLVEAGVQPLIAVTDSYRTVKHVMIAYSGSMESAKAMKRFLQMRLFPQVKLTLVTCEHPADQARRLLDDAREYCEAHGYEVTTHHVEASASGQLSVQAEAMNADLIVMGNSARNLLMRRIFGETVLQTVQNSDRPLFLAQ